MTDPINNAVKVAEFLLKINAVKLQPANPFIWASGWKSPIYCDNRKILGHPEIRTYIKNEFVSLSTNLIHLLVLPLLPLEELELDLWSLMN